VQPSSLVFLVLFAIWAVYLLQHWVRRREYLATAKSVDRFSAAMRVLERRHPLPQGDLTAPGTRSYDVSPARPSRPEVVAKRAQPPRPDVPTEPSAAVRPTRFFHFLARMSARRLRGFSLLASFFVALCVSALAAFSVLPAWSVLAVLAVVVADLMWLRHVAVAQAAHGRQADRASQETDEPQEQGSFSGHGERAAPSDVGSGVDVRADSDSDWDWRSRSDSRSDDGSQAPFDGEAETLVGSASRSQAGYGADPTLAIPVSAAELAESAEIPAYVDPSSWAPVPVPPPTYTLKAKAAEPIILPAELAEPTALECWSLDGLVYDCELDELVERRSATGA
jgi:hypothetical protein